MKYDICHIKPNDKGLIKKIGETLSFLKKDYPDFYNWYNDKIVNGVDKGSRHIFVATPMNNSNIIAGVLILKDEREEKKICTLYVMENHRGKGIGVAFIDCAINVLKTNKPMITISEHNKELFNPLLSKYNFKENKEYPDYYRKGVSEFAYNGYLHEFSSVLQAI